MTRQSTYYKCHKPVKETTFRAIYFFLLLSINLLIYETT